MKRGEKHAISAAIVWLDEVRHPNTPCILPDEIADMAIKLLSDGKCHLIRRPIKTESRLPKSKRDANRTA